MRRLLAVALLSLLSLSAEGMSKYKVLPASGPYYLDDTIEIIFERTKSDRPFLRAPGPESATNFTIGIEYYSAGNHDFGRLILKPIATGPASFGPSAIYTDMGGEPVAELPRLDFTIEPPIDPGDAPLEKVFADQKFRGRLPMAIRAEITGDVMLGRTTVIRWFLYSERGVGDVSVPHFEIATAEPSVDPYYTGDRSEGFASVGGMLIRKRLIREYYAMPTIASKLEMPPVYAEIGLLQDTVRETGLTRTRRIVALPPITVAPRPAGAPPVLPIGTFEIECPKFVGSSSEHRVTASLAIKGDATILGSRLRFEGDSPTPVLVDGPHTYYPSFKDGRVSVGGTFTLWTGPVEKGQRAIPFPAIAFDYYDLAAKGKRTLKCNAATLQLQRSGWASDEHEAPRKPPPQREAPKSSKRLFHIGQALAALFAIGAAVALAIAVRGR